MLCKDNNNSVNITSKTFDFKQEDGQILITTTLGAVRQ